MPSNRQGVKVWHVSLDAPRERAVDHQIGARDVARRWACRESDNIGDLLGPRHAAHRDHGKRVEKAFGLLALDPIPGG